MQKILDPRNDIVFKMYFSREKNKFLLISFLESVLMPPVPIADVKFLNEQLTKDYVDEKASILDLVVSFKDGTRCDIEMQMAPTANFRKRLLYYWSKLHRDQIKTGEDYHKLMPTISIAILNYVEFKNAPDSVHTIFELREKDSHELYLPDLELHFLELPKLHAWTKRGELKYDKMKKWMDFFKMKDDKTSFLKLQEDTIMSKAVDALEELSLDPEAQNLAEMREKARINFQIVTQGAYDEGVEKGLEKGLEKGREEGLEKGLETGKIENQKNIISLMLKKGMSLEQVADLLELDPGEIEKILK